jgi:hypothetical protein
VSILEDKSDRLPPLEAGTRSILVSFRDAPIRVVQYEVGAAFHQDVDPLTAQ